MTKYLLLIFAITALVFLGVSVAYADGGNAAIVANSDGDCWLEAEGYFAHGLEVYLKTQNGHWTLSCQADSYTGDHVSKTFVFRSIDKSPQGTCTTHARITNKFVIVFSPSGQTQFTCQGN